MSVSPAVSVAPSSVFALRERVHARGGLILEAEIDLLRAQGPGGAVGYVLEGVLGDHPDLSAASRLQLVQLWQRQGAWVEAHELAQTQAFEAQALSDSPRDAFDAARGSIAAELGLMTGSGAGFAHSRLEAARLVHPTGLLAETHQCLLRGWITTSTARMLADAAGDLIDGLGSKATLEQMKAVAEQLQARVLFASIKGIDPSTGVGAGFTRSLRTLSTTVTKSDSTSPKCWKTERTDTSARLATATTVGAVLVSAIMALAAAMIFRRVSAARRLRPSGRPAVTRPLSPLVASLEGAIALPRGWTAASLILGSYSEWGRTGVAFAGPVAY